ncbi:unnamed protein product [Ilex paraguariensis]|uniref:Uncharacterized protein n=1 Tax=Ilex paraguariensis TaxID=185542 RepID=A0ABC8TLP6_9AQUA
MLNIEPLEGKNSPIMHIESTSDTNSHGPSFLSLAHHVLYNSSQMLIYISVYKQYKNQRWASSKIRPEYLRKKMMQQQKDRENRRTENDKSRKKKEKEKSAIY